jgi:hypothetical protein
MGENFFSRRWRRFSRSLSSISFFTSPFYVSGGNAGGSPGRRAGVFRAG